MTKCRNPGAPTGALRLGRRGLLAAPFVLGLARRATAQGRPIRIVVPFAAGSEPDILARRLGAAMQPILDQPVVVDNRPGANTVIAAAHVAQSRPDGETILLTSSSTFATLPNLYSQPPVRLEQFEAMTMAMRAHMVLYVSIDVPANTIPDLLQWANAQRDPIHYGANRGSIGHLCGERMKQVTGIRMTDVSYRGSLGMQQLLMNGDIKLAFDGVPAHAEMVNANRIKAPQISRSLSIIWRNSSGELPCSSAPCAANWRVNSSARCARWMASICRARMGSGVPFGAKMPYQ